MSTLVETGRPPDTIAGLRAQRLMPVFTVIAQAIIRAAVGSAFFVLVGCVTPKALQPNGAASTQPIVNARGPVDEKKGDALLAQVAPEPTHNEQLQLERLVDAVRKSLSSPLAAGNKAVALVDGPATFAAINAAMQQAKQSVHVETYIFADDALGQAFAQLLVAKRQQGVEVRVIYDAVGSIATPARFFSDLRDAGVEVIEFRPINPVKTIFWRMHNRDHRKIIVVDGRVAFTGGLNISGAYSSSSSSNPGPEAGLTDGWRDTHVQITGPAVGQFQKLFLDTWSQLGGKTAAAAEKYYPQLAAAGDQLVSAVASSGAKEKDEAIFQTYLSAVRQSAKRVWITQAYFSPPATLRNALIEAVQRGVDVRVIVPGFTDSKLILHASRNEYQRLLAGGVRLIEAQEALLHAKTALIDDSLVIIGSANLDYRSFLHNNEVTAIIVGDDTGQRMRAIFERDLNRGKELTLAKWRERPFKQRMKESLSSLLKFWL